MDNTIHSYGIKTMCWPCVDTWKKSRFVVNFHEVCVQWAPFSTMSYCCVKQPLLVLFLKSLWLYCLCVCNSLSTSRWELSIGPGKKGKTGQSILLGRGSKLVSHFYGVADLSAVPGGVRDYISMPFSFKCILCICSVLKTNMNGVRSCPYTRLEQV